MPYLGPIRGDIGRELLARILREAHIARDEYSGGATLLLGPSSFCRTHRVVLASICSLHIIRAGQAAGLRHTGGKIRTVFAKRCNELPLRLRREMFKHLFYCLFQLLLVLFRIAG